MKSETLLKKWVDFKTKNYRETFDSKINVEAFFKFLNVLEDEGCLVQGIMNIREIVKFGKKSWLEDGDICADVQVYDIEKEKIDMEGYEMFVSKETKLAEFRYDAMRDISILEYLNDVKKLHYFGQLNEGKNFYQCGKYYYEWYDPIELHNEITAKMVRYS